MKNKILYWLVRKYKHALQRIFPRKLQNVLCIMGCQRSGTSILIRVFDWDFTSRVYRELDTIFSHMRLKKSEFVNNEFKRSGAEFIVAKPLLDSQIANSILDSLDEVSILWMYRNYKSVAKSNLQYFGEHNGVKDLQYIVDDDDKDWRNQHVLSEDRDFIRRLFKDGISDLDAAAYFWYIRNKFLFDNGLSTNLRVLVADYDDLVSKPDVYVAKIYSFLGRSYPGNRIIKEIHANALNRGKRVQLHPEIEEKCIEIQMKLDDLKWSSHV